MSQNDCTLGTSVGLINNLDKTQQYQLLMHLNSGLSRGGDFSTLEQGEEQNAGVIVSHGTVHSAHKSQRLAPVGALLLHS